MPELERDLRALGEALAFPSTPDLADGIGRRLPVRSSPPWRRRAVLLAAVVTAALLATLAIPQARSALVRIFGIGAVRIEYVDRLPGVEPNEPLALGLTISSEDAPFRPLQSELLGPPDGLYAKGDVVTLLYGSTDEVRVLVTQIGRQALEPETVKKIVQATTNTTVVEVEGSPAPALWIEGDAHVLDLPGSPARLARNTLIWTRDGLTLRVEGATSLEQAIRIAESFR